MSKFKKLYNYPLDWNGDFYYPISDKKSDFYKKLIYLIVLLFCIIVILNKIFTWY